MSSKQKTNKGDLKKVSGGTSSSLVSSPKGGSQPTIQPKPSTKPSGGGGLAPAPKTGMGKNSASDNLV